MASLDGVPKLPVLTIAWQLEGTEGSFQAWDSYWNYRTLLVCREDRPAKNDDSLETWGLLPFAEMSLCFISRFERESKFTSGQICSHVFPDALTCFVGRASVPFAFCRSRDCLFRMEWEQPETQGQTRKTNGQVFQRELEQAWAQLHTKAWRMCVCVCVCGVCVCVVFCLFGWTH